MISYVSIVVGELTAKRLALQRAEVVALALAPLVDFTARVARPVIWLLGVSTNVLVRVLGGDPKISREEVTNEEIRTMVSGSTTLGDEERRIVEEVFAAGERSLREVMVPRTEVDFLPGDMPVHRAVRELTKAPHSRYPVIGDSADDIIGFVHVRDLLDPDLSSRTTPVAEVARTVLSMPDTVRVLRALSDMRRSSSHLAIVLDEYGGTAGIVTMEDLVEELVGDITDEYDVVAEERVGVRGDLVIDGLTTLEDFAEETGLVLPEGPYDTLAGFFMARLGQLPSVGDAISLELASIDPADEEPAQVELRGQRAGWPPGSHLRRPSAGRKGLHPDLALAASASQEGAGEKDSERPPQPWNNDRHAYSGPRSGKEDLYLMPSHSGASRPRVLSCPAHRGLSPPRQLPGCAAPVGATARRS